MSTGRYASVRAKTYGALKTTVPTCIPRIVLSMGVLRTELYKYCPDPHPSLVLSMGTLSKSTTPTCTYLS